MADQKNNKNIIIGACAAIVAVVIIIVAIVLATSGGRLDDSYFVSDGTKYVMTEEYGEDSAEGDPVKVHYVYTYSGDEITGLKVYSEYADETAAKTAYDTIAANAGEDSFKSISLNGKYVILEANESEYEGVTASDVKEQVEFIESLKNMNIETDTTDEEETVVEETNEEETTVEETNEEAEE